MRRRPASLPRGAAPPLRAWYETLERAWGAQGWWPARSRFEVVVGAVLTQAVSWKNVEQAIRRMRRARLLTPAAISAAGRAAIERAIRPAGYHTQKARTLGAIAAVITGRHGGRLDRFLKAPTPDLRRTLLQVRGIGPETADAILLYAARRPVFVIDAYTRRILARHGAARGDEPYETLRTCFEAALPADVPMLNQFHALLVRVGKERCRKRAPDCRGCPLEAFLPPGGPRDPIVRINPARRRRPRPAAGD